ncbi:unnamed protein product, partial [Discosporangium mesarthrocarpum]
APFLSPSRAGSHKLCLLVTLRAWQWRPLCRSQAAPETLPATLSTGSTHTSTSLKGMSSVDTVPNVAERKDGGADVTFELIDEMVPFLRDPRPEIRQAAARTAAAASATPNGVFLLDECGAVKWLCRLTGDIGSTGTDAVTALVNVSADNTPSLDKMCSTGLVDRLMENLSSAECTPALRDLCLKLLANVSRIEVGRKDLCQGGGGEGGPGWGAWGHEGGIPCGQAGEVDGGVPSQAGGVHGVKAGRCEGKGLRGRAAFKDYRGEASLLDPWQHCASVLCNISRTKEGRQVLNRPRAGLLQKLLPDLGSPNPVRRAGVAGCLRNTCFDEPEHPRLLHELKVVPNILRRLSDRGDEYGFEEKVELDPGVWREEEEGSPPHLRESCLPILKLLVEALLQLCSTLESREALRKMGVYYVVRELDKAL